MIQSSLGQHDSFPRTLWASHDSQGVIGHKRTHCQALSNHHKTIYTHMQHCSLQRFYETIRASPNEQSPMSQAM